VGGNVTLLGVANEQRRQVRHICSCPAENDSSPVEGDIIREYVATRLGINGIISYKDSTANGAAATAIVELKGVTAVGSGDWLGRPFINKLIMTMRTKSRLSRPSTTKKQAALGV
jgi:hypothetical protein